MNRSSKKPHNKLTSMLTPRQRKAIYGRWYKMIRRCHRKANSDYHRYGGKQIRVHMKWRGPNGFNRFLEFVVDELALPVGLSLDAVLFPAPGEQRYSLDRIKNRNGYYPSNIRWATPPQQSSNQDRTVFVEIDGRQVPRTEAARRAGVDTGTAAKRQRDGYTPEEAVSLPIGGRTAESRVGRDAVILALIKAGIIFVDRDGFVFVRGADGLKLARVAPVSQGRYLGVSFSIPPSFHALIPAERVAARKRSGAFRDGFTHHRVVALFHHVLPSGDGYYEADHINRNKLDNRPENLRWLTPSENRPGGDGESTLPTPRATPPVDYRSDAAQQRALAAALARDQGEATPAVEVDGPGLPLNVSEALVERAIAAVRTDQDFPSSIWSRDHYWAILPSVLRAADNRLTWSGEVPAITCTNQSASREMQVPVIELATSYRVFFACETHGRQAMVDRTEIRNRTSQRYGATEWACCQALDVQNPVLAGLLAHDRVTGIRPHPSMVSVGSSRAFHFRCRVPGCQKILLRRPKLLGRDNVLPVCEDHRRRGNSFRGKPATST